MLKSKKNKIILFSGIDLFLSLLSLKLLYHDIDTYLLLTTIYIYGKLFVFNSQLENKFNIKYFKSRKMIFLIFMIILLSLWFYNIFGLILIILLPVFFIILLTNSLMKKKYSFKDLLLWSIISIFNILLLIFLIVFFIINSNEKFIYR